MAMNTWLQLVSEAEIKSLKANPASINELDKPGKETFSTYFPCCINYFLLGDAYPNHKNPLGGMLFGFSYVNTNTLEGGNFGVVKPDDVKKIVLASTKIDYKKLAKKIEEADPDELEEEEVDDWEVLTDDGDETPEEIAKILISEIKQLIAFYKYAEKKQLGVVMYTT